MTVRKQQKDNRLIFKRLCKRFIFRIFARRCDFCQKNRTLRGINFNIQGFIRAIYQLTICPPVQPIQKQDGELCH